MSFGWSAGDIVSAIKLITEIVNALDEAQGVVDEYRSTTYFLTSLTRTIAVFSELETNQLPDALKTELSSQLYHIKIHIEAFLSEISQYRKLINPLQYKNKLSNVRSKLSWHFKVEERVRKLQNAICKNLQILEILLQRAILSMVSTNRAAASADLRQVISELLPYKINQNKDESLDSDTMDVISLDKGDVPHAEADKFASRSQTKSETSIRPASEVNLIAKFEIPLGASNDGQMQNSAFLFVVWLLICNTLQAALHGLRRVLAPITELRAALSPDQSIYLLDAIGRHYALPYSYFQHLEVFLGFLQATFKGKSGSAWVNTGRYQLFGARYKVASIVTPSNWSCTICPGVTIFMSMVVEHSQHPAFDLECPLEACEGRLISRLGSAEGWTKCSECRKEVFIVPPLATEATKHTSKIMVPDLASALQTSKPSTSSPQSTGHAIRTMYLTDHALQDSIVGLDYTQMISFMRITKRLNVANPGCRPSNAFLWQANDRQSLWHRTLIQTKGMFRLMRVIYVEFCDADKKELRKAIRDMHAENHDMELLQLLTERNFEALNLSLYNIKTLIRLVNGVCCTERVGGIILSACLAIIEYGRQESIPLRDLLNLITEINHVLSNLRSNRLCSSAYLRNVFNAYFDYCLLTVNAIRSGGDWRSCPRTSIAKIALEAHVRGENFDVEVLKEERLVVLERLKAGQEKLRRRLLGI